MTMSINNEYLAGLMERVKKRNPNLLTQWRTDTRNT